jgi:hypothetical protein
MVQGSCLPKILLRLKKIKSAKDKASTQGKTKINLYLVINKVRIS